MNPKLEALILAYEAFSVAKDLEAARLSERFENLLDEVLEQHPGLSRDALRKSIIKAHLKWASKQATKPPTIPPKA